MPTSDIVVIIVAAISAAGLTAAGFVTGVFNKPKVISEVERNTRAGLLEELKYKTEELSSVRQALVKCEAEKQVITEQRDAERTTCRQEIDQLRTEIEGFRQTISRLRLEIGLGPEH